MFVIPFFPEKKITLLDLILLLCSNLSVIFEIYIGLKKFNLADAERSTETDLTIKQSGVKSQKQNCHVDMGLWEEGRERDYNGGGEKLRKCEREGEKIRK